MKRILDMICHPHVGGDLLAVLFVFLVACTDYVQQIDDRDGEWNRFVPSTMTDSRDGKTYKIVTIGNQTWMAENLNYEMDYKRSSFCYKDSTKYCAKYGHLYTWEAAMEACPDGWHLPSEDEFNTLFVSVGGQSVAGKMLKSSSGWQSGNGLDNYAFSALPVGRRYPDDGRYYLNGYAAYFWSSTENSVYGANYIYMDDDSDDLEIENSSLSLAYSVRCIKDELNTQTQSGSSIKSSSSATSSSSEKAESSSSKTPEPAEGMLNDSRDGQTYKTVSIGTQTWMAENLNYAYTGVPYNISGYTSDFISWCYDNNASDCTKYGRLYTWAAAMDSVGTWSTNGKGCGFRSECSPTLPVRGVCPEGWHLPTKAEFETLFTAVGGQSVAGTKLKSTSGWKNGGNGTDAYAFSVLPSGSRLNSGGYYGEGGNAYFWSSTEIGGGNAYIMLLNYYDEDVTWGYGDKIYGYSVRCVKDD